MTSKEKLKAIKDYFWNEQEPNFNAHQYFEDIKKDLELLDILKEFLSEANTGTDWIEININPNHDVLDSEEHKKKQLLIKEWLNE